MKKIIVVSCLLLVVSYLMVSCGLKTETTRYFYGPSWVRDGKIIFVGELNTADKDILGSQLGSSYSQYVATIYPAGTGESSSLFDTTDTSIYSMSCSPATDYVAYMIGRRSGLFSTIVIRNIATGVHTGLEMVELDFSPRIKSFDWSPDGTELVYCTTTEVKIIDVDGANDTPVASGTSIESVSWSQGGRIAYVHTSGSIKYLTLIYPGGSVLNIEYLATQTINSVQISKVNTNEVFAVVDGDLLVLDISVSPPSSTVIESGFTGVLAQLSPVDATKLTYSKSGENSGIYVLDISDRSNPVETKIK